MKISRSLVRGGKIAVKASSFFIGAAIEQLGSSLLPSVCPVCLYEHSSLFVCCSYCRSHFSAVPVSFSSLCHYCLDNSAVVPYSLCGSCRYSSLFSSVFSLGWYFDPTLCSLIRRYKYGDLSLLSRDFAFMLSSCFPASLRVPRTLFLPVPLSAVRERERGYSQSALLARDLALSLGCSYSSSVLLRRTHHTVQSELSRRERFSASVGNYTMRSGCWDWLSSFNSIVLVDDIMTSGATLYECGFTLRRADFKGNLYACVIARER